MPRRPEDSYLEKYCTSKRVKELQHSPITGMRDGEGGDRGSGKTRLRGYEAVGVGWLVRISRFVFYVVEVRYLGVGIWH